MQEKYVLFDQVVGSTTVNCIRNCTGLVFTKGLSEVLGLNLVLLYRTLKPKTFHEYVVTTFCK